MSKLMIITETINDCCLCFFCRDKINLPSGEATCIHPEGKEREIKDWSSSGPFIPKWCPLPDAEETT